MYASLHKTCLKRKVVRGLSQGCGMVATWLSRGCPNELFFNKDFLNAEGVRDSVFLPFSCCSPQCRYVHISTWVRDTTVREIC